MASHLARMAAAGALLLAAAPAHAQYNVALGAPVTLQGTFGVLRAGSIWAPAPAPAPAATVTDGVLLPEGTQWNTGTVWWDAAVPGSDDNAIIVDLGAVYAINFLRIQADDNESYLIDYRVAAGDPWITGLFAQQSAGGGMRTRSGAVGPFDASQFRIRGSGGDLYYSVSEFQAFAAVPEPATLALVGGGLAVVAIVSRRRRRA